MRKITTLIMALLISIGAFASPMKYHNGQVYDNTRGNSHYGRGSNDWERRGFNEFGMFSGLSLTKEQREQIRDLMSKKVVSRPYIDYDSLNNIHRLIISDSFDEAAVRKAVEANMKNELDSRVAEIKTRNQVYHLLTPEQKKIYNQRHEENLKKISSWRQ